MTSETNQTEYLDLGQEEPAGLELDHAEELEAPEGFDMDMSLAPSF